MSRTLKRYSVECLDGRQFYVEADEVELMDGHLIFKSERRGSSVFNVRVWDRAFVVSEVVQQGRPFAAPEEHKPVTLSADAEDEEGWA